MRKYRIGFLLGSLNGAGAEKTIIVIAKQLAVLGHNVYLLLLKNTGDYFPPENIKLIEVEGEGRHEKNKSLSVICEKTNFNFFVTSRAEYYDAISAEKIFASVHITPTAWIDLPKWRFLKRWMRIKRLKSKFKGKNLIALSYGIKNDLVSNLGCDESNIVVLNNPFELSVMRSKSIERQHGYDFEYIVYVASFIERKRHEDLINAFHMLKNDSIKLVLVGKGELESKIKALVSARGLTDRVVFHGWDANPYSIIKNARVSVLVSSAEGLPRTLVESLVLGVPMVSTDCPSGPNEVLTGNLAKFLVPIGDTVALANAIDSALIEYPEIKPEVVERFDAKLVANRYISLFEK
ncbi:glycosyltransferase [Amphritea sp. 1_MG-2023]|uniref:glycosyltransferase n=1 Tax=Amphritea sp. 1_MG-2023 TaxID=3062670 RepID=UPI0026E3B57B|nr:glycosyltransferase [Amphritea sp. 1_MG-2023]MDO6564786.1 glycosyltransferase [Amphritea sp. 1_MG-2023]